MAYHDPNYRKTQQADVIAANYGGPVNVLGWQQPRPVPCHYGGVLGLISTILAPCRPPQPHRCGWSMNRMDVDWRYATWARTGYIAPNYTYHTIPGVAPPRIVSSDALRAEIQARRAMNEAAWAASHPSSANNSRPDVSHVVVENVSPQGPNNGQPQVGNQDIRTELQEGDLLHPTGNYGRPTEIYPFDVNGTYSAMAYSSSLWKEGLEQHGIKFVEEAGKHIMVIQSSSVPNYDLTYELTDEQYKKIIPDTLYTDESTSVAKAYQNCLDNINEIIAPDWQDKITAAQLKSRSLINISLNEQTLKEIQEEAREKIFVDIPEAMSTEPEERNVAGVPVTTAQYLQLTEMGENYKSNRLDEDTWLLSGDPKVINNQLRWGVQQDSGLSDIMVNKSWYREGKDGRRVSVTDIDVSKGEDGAYRLKYSVNGEERSKEISEKDAMKYMAVNKAAQLELVAKWADDIEIHENRSRGNMGKDTLYYGQKDTGHISGEELSAMASDKAFYRKEKNGRMVIVGDIFVTKDPSGYTLNVETVDKSDKSGRELNKIRLSEKDYNEYMRRSDLARVEFALDKMGGEIALKDWQKEETLANKYKLNLSPAQWVGINYADVDNSRYIRNSDNKQAVSNLYINITEDANAKGVYRMSANIDGEEMSAVLTDKQVERLNKAKNQNDIRDVVCDVFPIEKKGYLSTLDKFLIAVNGVAGALAGPMYGPCYPVPTPTPQPRFEKIQDMCSNTFEQMARPLPGSMALGI